MTDPSEDKNGDGVWDSLDCQGAGADTLLDREVTTVKLADTAVTAQKISRMGAQVNQVLTWTGTTWAPQGAPAAAESDPTWIGPADSASAVSRIGNVSIGTTSGDTAKLHIVTGASSEGLRIRNNSSNQFGLRITNEAGASVPLRVDNASNRGVEIYTSGSPGTSVGITNLGTGNAVRIDNFGEAGRHALYVVNESPGLAGYFSGSSADVVIEGDLSVGGTVSAKLAPATVALDLQLVEGTGVSVSSNATVDASLSCPSGYKALSGGWENSGGPNQLFVPRSLPENSSLATWLFQFRNGGSTTTTVYTYVICGRVTP